MEKIPEDLRQLLERFNLRKDPRFWRSLEVTIHNFRSGYRQAGDAADADDELHPEPACPTQTEPTYPTHNDYLMAKTQPEHARLLKAARTAKGKKALAKKEGASKLAEAEQAVEAWKFRKYSTAQWRDAIYGLFITWINGTGRLPTPDHTRILRSLPNDVPADVPTGDTFNAFLLIMKDYLDKHNNKDEALLTLAERLLQEGSIRNTLQAVITHLDDPTSPRGPFFPDP